MPGWTATILLVMARVSAMLLVIPGVSPTVVSLRTRALLLVLLVMPVLCVVPAIAEPVAVPLLGSLLVHELVVGVSIGLVPAALVWGMQISVDAIHGMTGLPGNLPDPGGDPAIATGGTAMQRLITVSVVTIFFVSSGHRQVIGAVLDSFSWLPPGSYRSLDTTKEVLLDLLSASFHLGVKAMLPIAASLAIGLLGLAAINRVVPQIGYFAAGMSVQAAILVGTLFLFVGAALWLADGGFAAVGAASRFAWQGSLSGAAQ